MKEIAFSFTKAERIEGEVRGLLDEAEAMEPDTQMSVFRRIMDLTESLTRKLEQLRAEDVAMAEAIESRVWQASYVMGKVLEMCWTKVFNAGQRAGDGANE